MTVTLVRWQRLTRDEYQTKCRHCGAMIEFRPRYREWFCPHPKCGHNHSLDPCDCRQCQGDEGEVDGSL